MKKNILAISGISGLYLLVSRGRTTLIVESIDEQKKRHAVSLRDKITSLNDISIFTDGDDVLLTTVFESIRTATEGKPLDIEVKKATKKDLENFLAGVLPNYDRDKVYPNDIRKIINWYNILIKNGISDFKEKDEATEKAEDNSVAAEA